MPDTNRTRPATADRPSPGTLSERVRSLRLNDRPMTGGGTAWFPWALCGVLAVCTVFFALEALAPIPDDVLKKMAEAGPADAAGETKGGETKGGETKGAAPAAAVPAGSAANAPAPGAIAHESKGNIVPVHTIQVSPLVGGRVVELNFVEGRFVKEGFVLAKIEDVEYRRDYERFQAMEEGAAARVAGLSNHLPRELEQLDAELKDAMAQRDQMFSDYKRSTELRGSRTLSTRDYEQAESIYRSQEQKVRRLELAIELMKAGTRQEQIKAAEAERKQVRAELGKAKWKLDNTIVTAPISGTVLTKTAEKGNMVNPAAFSNGLAASLCEMADLADLEVDLSVAERDISKVFPGQACVVRPEAYPGRKYDGTVSRIMPKADQAKAAIPVRVKIAIPAAETGRYLLPAMGAIVTFYNRTAEARAGEKK